MISLDPSNCRSYLKETGFLKNRTLVNLYLLGGGVSNRVLKIETRQGDFVLKQAHARLQVRDEWLADVTRIHRERDALRFAAKLFDGHHVPRVVFSDEANHVLIMTSAPPGWRSWKEELLAGTVDTEPARLLGRLLGTLHARTRHHAEVREVFGSDRAFDQLRVDPYYRTTAARHPDLAEGFQQAIDEALRVKECLVHGDFSPKNILVADPEGASPGTTREPLLLDFEVVHYGDPSFDAAFFLNHLYIKSMFVAGRKSELFSAAGAFWQAYTRAVKAMGWRDLEPRTLRHLGCLMLARVDGKSPVEYLREEGLKERVRRVARAVITGPVSTLSGVEALIDES